MGPVFLFGGQSLDPGCRSADLACSVAVVTDEAAPDRLTAEGHHLASRPYCGRTREPYRCDSYQPDRNDKKLPAKTDRKTCLNDMIECCGILYSPLGFSWKQTLSVRLMKYVCLSISFWKISISALLLRVKQED